MNGTTAANPLDIFKPVTADPKGTQIKSEVLEGRGIVVQYRGSRLVEKVDKTTSKKHLFITRGGAGKAFELWGTSALDGKLAKVRSGAIILLGYGGKHAHPDMPGKELHDWVVNDSGRSVLSPPLTAAIENTEAHTVAVEAAIAEQHAADIARMDAARQSGAAPEVDIGQHDDLPF